MEGDGWSARVLPGAPLIAPVRSYTFPLSIAGEEDALARGAMWVDVRVAGGSGFTAQCAQGYATGGVAQGVWPAGKHLLAVAGGYAYTIDPLAPGATTLLPLRPVVRVLGVGATVVLVGFHTLLVLAHGEAWQSGRLSWEGVTLTSLEDDTLTGLGWDVNTDEEVPFTLHLHTRELRGGGYRG